MRLYAVVLIFGLDGMPGHTLADLGQWVEACLASEHSCQPVGRARDGLGALLLDALAYTYDAADFDTIAQAMPSAPGISGDVQCLKKLVIRPNVILI